MKRSAVDSMDGYTAELASAVAKGYLTVSGALAAIAVKCEDTEALTRALGSLKAYYRWHKEQAHYSVIDVRIALDPLIASHAPRDAILTEARSLAGYFLSPVQAEHAAIEAVWLSLPVAPRKRRRAR